MRPYTAFGKTQMLPVIVYVDGTKVEGDDYEKTLWVERSEDWYAMMSPQYRGKRVWVIERRYWLHAERVAELGCSWDFVW